jgi:hypothetical protein
LFVSSPQRPLATPNQVVWFAKSQVRVMHFKNQHALMVQQEVMSSKSRRLRSVEGLTPYVERRQSQPPDTDSRLLTELNRSRVSEERKLNECAIGTADVPFQREYNGGRRAHVAEQG